MTLRLNTALRNVLADTFGTAFDVDGRINFYTGAQPATADAAPTGTLLATISLAADAFAAASAGVAAAAAIPNVTALASGTPGWFRLYKAADGAGASSTLKRMDGSVTATGGGGDMTFDNINWVLGGVEAVTAFSFDTSNWA
jgi:hypothetical protein